MLLLSTIHPMLQCAVSFSMSIILSSIGCIRCAAEVGRATSLAVHFAFYSVPSN